jgi:predicted metalloprotease with PDZ domain
MRWPLPPPPTRPGSDATGARWKTPPTTRSSTAAGPRPGPAGSEDYYSEGQLVWLDADTLIRTRSAGKRSLDDFAKAFFGIENGNWSERPYTFEDLVAALNAVEPYDWARFLHERIDEVAPKPPLDGLTRGGWRLVYTDTETAYLKSAQARRKTVDFTYSIGLTVARDGDVAGVQWDGPAFKAGMALGGKLLAVNGIVYDPDRLKEAITAAKGGAPLSLLVKTGDHYKAFDVVWKGGLRYPRLERIEGTPDLLSAIYAPKK